MDGMDGMVKGAWYSRKLSALPREFSSPCPLRPQSPAPWPCHPHSNHDLTNVVPVKEKGCTLENPCKYPTRPLYLRGVHYGGKHRIPQPNHHELRTLLCSFGTRGFNVPAAFRGGLQAHLHLTFVTSLHVQIHQKRHRRKSVYINVRCFIKNQNTSNVNERILMCNESLTI